MKKKSLIAFAILIVIALGSFLYLKYRKLDDFEGKIRQKLQQLVTQGSKGLYRLEVDKINVDVVNSRLVLSNLHIGYDSVVYSRLLASKRAPSDLFDIRLNSFAIDGISPADIISKKDIRLNIIYADHPVVNIYHHNEAVNVAAKDKGSFYQLIRHEVGSFGLKKLALKNLDFTYHKAGKKVQSSFRDLYVDLDDILIDSTTQYDTTRFFYARDAAISLKKFVYKTADSIYNFKLDSISIQAAKNRVSIKQLQLEPRGNKMHFRKMLKLRKDRYDITVNNIVLNDIDWWRFVTDDGLFIQDALVANGKIEIYSDKAIPPGNKIKLGDYPHQKLFKLDMPLYVRRIRMKNMDVTYSEFNITTMKEGHIIFRNTTATVANVTNIPQKIGLNAHLNIDAVTQFMDAGTLKAGFNFNLARQKEGIFSVYADLGRMDGRVLNKATIPLASVEVKEVQIQRLKVEISGNNYNARGKIFLTYNDLKINVLKKDDDGKMKKRGLMSFIANNFKINESYPDKGKKPETFNSFYQRPLKKSFFSLIWKTIFGGVKEAVGI